MSDLKGLISTPGTTDAIQPTRLSLVKATAGKKDPEAIAKACEDTEKMFLTQLLKQMRQSMLSGELSQASQQSEQYWGIVEEEFSKHLAAAGGIGLGRWLKEQLSKETVKNPAAQLVGKSES